MKKLLFGILFLLVFSNTYAQPEIARKDWSRLVDMIVAEDWVPANKLSLSFLSSIPFTEVNSREASKLRYMYILSEAGLLSTGKVTKSEVLSSVTGFVGKPVWLPAYPISQKRESDSYTADLNAPDTLTLTEGNTEDDVVFTLYRIVLKNKWTVADVQANTGKTWRFGGNVKSVAVKSKRLEIIIEDAIAEEPRK
ncbi:hypothetical protein [Mucilaginibacter pedocola]|uniref:DUF3828 domain-containing protein n=1 Tax=Mucilaginibacter pedocola TaxID=1792845 RepID=A0A1S9PCZ7_9SPHI|nr:hypothetical protein [Mucilaginibacter pedocola]OOQ58707.1 hypothetical protein BC343_08565 [Mucilaginibacter pedocola]